MNYFSAVLVLLICSVNKITTKTGGLGTKYDKSLRSVLPKDASIDTLNLFMFTERYYGVAKKMLVETYQFSNQSIQAFEKLNILQILTCNVIQESSDLMTIMNTIKTYETNAEMYSKVMTTLLAYFKHANQSLVEQTFPANYNKSMSSFCFEYYNFTESIYDPILINAFTKNTVTKREEFDKFTQFFHIENTIKSNILNQFRASPIISLIDVKSEILTGLDQLYYDSTIRATFHEFMAKQMNISEAASMDLFRELLFSEDNENVVFNKLKLNILAADFNVNNVSFKHLYMLVEENGKKLESMYQNKPMILVASAASLNGLEPLLNETVLSLLRKSTMLMDDFITGWYKNDLLDVNQTSRYSLYEVFMRSFSHYPIIRMLHLSLLRISTVSHIEELNTGSMELQNKRFNILVNEGYSIVFANLTIDGMIKLYAISPNDVKTKKIKTILTKKVGMMESEFKTYVSPSVLPFINDTTLQQLLSYAHINGKTKISATDIKDGNNTIFDNGKYKVLLKIQYAVLPHFCKMSRNNLLMQSLSQLSLNCTGSLRAIKNNNILYAMRNKTIESIVNMLVNDTTVSKHIDYFNLKEIFILADNKNATYLCKTLSEILNVTDSADYVSLASQSLPSLLLKTQYFSSAAEILQILNGLYDISLSYLNFPLHVIASYAKGYYNLFNLKLLRVLGQLEAVLNPLYEIFIPYYYVDLLKLCNISSTTLLSFARENCLDNTTYLDIIGNKMETFSVNEISEMTNVVNITRLDIASFSIISQHTYDRLNKQADLPLILLAHRENISIPMLLNTNLVATSVKIFHLGKDIVAKTFDIPEAIVQNAATVPLSSFTMVAEDIENIKHIYTVSLKTLYKVVKNTTSIKRALTEEYPKFVQVLSAMSLDVLSKVYEFNDVQDFENYSLVSLAGLLFGISSEHFQQIFSVSDSEMKILTKRTLKQIKTLQVYERTPIDLYQNSPIKVAEVLLSFDNSLQEILLSTLKEIAVSSGDVSKAYGKIQDLFPSNISFPYIVSFIKNHSYNIFEYINSTEYLDQLGDVNISKVAANLNISVDTFINVTTFGRLITTLIPLTYNECTTKKCPVHSTCLLQLHGATCKCNYGWTENGCKDTDECLSHELNNCWVGQQGFRAKCINTPGSFTCSCPHGFHGNGTQCESTNECSANPCYTDVTCTDTYGSYTCGDCPPDLSGDGKVCYEIDCSNATCGSNSVCEIHYRKKTCVCTTGYFKKNGACVKASSITKVTGFRFLETYLVQYNDRTSQQYKDFEAFFVAEIINVLKKSHNNVAGARVIALSRGSVIVDSLIFSDKDDTGENISPAQVQTALRDAVTNGGLSKLNPDPSSVPSVQNVNICDLGGHTCDADSTCVALSTYDYKCEKTKSKSFIYIIVAVIAVLLVICVLIFVFFACRHSQRKKRKQKFDVGKNLAMTNRFTY